MGWELRRVGNRAAGVTDVTAETDVTDVTDVAEWEIEPQVRDGHSWWGGDARGLRRVGHEGERVQEGER